MNNCGKTILMGNSPSFLTSDLKNKACSKRPPGAFVIKQVYLHNTTEFQETLQGYSFIPTQARRMEGQMANPVTLSPVSSRDVRKTPLQNSLPVWCGGWVSNLASFPSQRVLDRSRLAELEFKLHP